MASSSNDLLLTRLKALRRRATLVLFVQAFCLSLAAVVLICEALVAGGAVHNIVTAVATATMAALITAAVATAVLRPRLSDIAAVIDARLHLQDRLVTALQFNGGTDPFSQLVVRDAHARVAAVRASDAVPFALPRGIRAAAGVAAMVLAVMVIATTEAPGWSPAGWTGFGGPGASTNASGTAARTSIGATRQPQNPAVGSSIAAGTPTERSSGTRQPDANPTGVTTPSVQASSLSQAMPSSGSTEQRERGPTSRGDTGANTGGANTPGEAGGAAGAASRSNAQLGGGVANGARSARTAETTRLDDSTYRAAYQSGRAAAESAVAQNRVPADLKSYVRDYFVAIRPVGDK